MRVPKLRNLPFETAIIERYKRREESVEEALIEMYLAGVSVRRVEDISEALWGAKVSPGTISNLNQKAYVQIEEWRNRKLEVEYPYVYLDGIYLKKNWGGTIENIAILVALGVNSAGNREIIGAAEGGKEDKESWLKFLRSLKDRGLSGVRLMVGDKCHGLVEALREVSRHGLPALHRPLHEECIHGSAKNKGKRNWRQIESNLCPGRPRSLPQKSRRGCTVSA